MGGAFALAWALTVAPVERAPELLRLQWSAPESCPTHADVRDRISSQLSAADTERPLVQVDADIHVVEIEGGFRARLEVTTPTGLTERELSATTCAVIVDASALIVAMAADTAAAQRMPAAEPEPPKPPPRRPAVWGLVGVGGGIAAPCCTQARSSFRCSWGATLGRRRGRASA
jgi:hypothetical protein